ncbi:MULTISPECIES: substrate-binding domain-containing protein [Eubacterium]|jgi:phosphate transport system substrate-binding protein|uniref:Substrate-binding domain-containing protein n=1 Tax=Eubacterium album TaxID=2978477 RepID=A0ABT2LX79_9FIRM|nr:MULTISPECIES: substrate-binding domain-containing protein [unclassified Eubacterium (in: firmicutes)]MCT7397900.1 substrate-binding domain-containing protein [Eubacterium sp. LFL-14]RGG65887.1 phosphate ABC transporter substrate-binding protein [Eubacterium sp. AF17-7]RHR34264.1 phosphate ABC transporter substrate-binding protein [Eubacterium sp. AF19-12LB]CDA29101.1 phosphate ABC transporter substrate-binding protein PhoT family (TC 3.A.1.7.1) [Eubacterium sp. CAG:156]
MRKLAVLALSAALVMGTMTGCGSTNSDAKNSDNAGTNKSASSETGFDTSKDISVVSREDGSGTRGAFIELTGVEEKDADGNKVDNTTLDASITNSTEVMMTTVSGNDYAIGYASLGSLNDTVKAVKVGGVEATADNINAGTYTLARPFNIVTGDSVSEVAQDFINYIMSEDGQKIISDNGYIEVENTGSFTSSKVKGSIVVAGSSSVTPVMEKLKEAYAKVNSNASIEIQESDSTTGVNSAIEGTCDIGMASRDLKDEEKGVKATAIAKDGIAVIVNNNNTIDDLTVDQIKDIFTGAVTTWADVK